MFFNTSVNATKLTSDSQGFKILDYIIKNEGATKYDCLTQALGKRGTRDQLRGYYSVYFQSLRANNVLIYNNVSKKYHITPLGLARYVVAQAR